MIYLVCLHAEDAIAAMREALPPSVLEMVEAAARAGHRAGYAFNTEAEASTFLHGFFPDLVAAMPEYIVNEDGEHCQRITIFRAEQVAGIVATVEGIATTDIEAANLVMRQLVAFDFNLWMPADRAALVAANIRKLCDPIGAPS